ncbi:MAG: RNA polymerase sigma-54 factor, partial [Gammaproteobacteria bacterium]
MKQSLQLRIGQSLTMTPQLQQAIKLLQLSSLELQTEIQQTLDANPLLEQEDNFEEVTISELDKPVDRTSEGDDTTEFKPVETVAENRSEQTLPDELEVDTGWDDIYDNIPLSPTQSQSNHEDNRDQFENQSGYTDTLKVHLNWQLDCSHLSETDFEVGQAIIDSIDDNGYLTQPLEDIYSGLLTENPDLDLDEVEAVLRLIQRFDPIGVAARSPSECMS